MTNKDRGNFYFSSAKEEYKAMKKQWKKKNWNRVIRKSQETIEFLLKGIFKYINIEFPKEHDIGEYFEKILIKRKVPYNREELEKIRDLSKDLANKRAPAYYGEEFYSKEEARTAKEGALFVKKFVKDLLKKLEG